MRRLFLLFIMLASAGNFYGQTTGGGGGVPGGNSGSGLPVATGAGQVPTSTGAGTTYTAQTPAAVTPTVTLVTSACTISAGGFFYNNTSGAMSCTLPTITSGLVGTQFCFRNFTGKTGVITLQEPASTTLDVNGAVASTAGTLVSGGALGDGACVVAVSTTLYAGYIGTGTWTNN